MNQLHTSSHHRDICNYGENGDQGRFPTRPSSTRFVEFLTVNQHFQTIYILDGDVRGSKPAPGPNI